MKPRIEYHRRAKLPPILEIDEDGVPVTEIEMWERPRWSCDGDNVGIAIDELPAGAED